MRENEIRPPELLAQYLQLSAQDANLCFGGAPCTSLSCVACGSPSFCHAFVKNEFSYSLCDDCRSLYLNPRPSLDRFTEFYRNSASSIFWANELFPATAEIRRQTIFLDRVGRLLDLCSQNKHRVDRLIEVGAGYGIFLEEWRKQCPNTELVAIEPSATLAGKCRDKGFKVLENMVEEVCDHRGFADLVVCFEVMEHVHDPLVFLKHLVRLARPGGIVLISTLCIDGFDLQVLWDQSTQIFPPHHINFLSVKGFQRLFTRAGLEKIDVITPGRLDVDIVCNAFRSHPEVLNNQRFLEKILSDEKVARAFQEFLSAHRLSSHAWVYGRLSEEK